MAFALDDVNLKETIDGMQLATNTHQVTNLCTAFSNLDQGILRIESTRNQVSPVIALQRTQSVLTCC